MTWVSGMIIISADSLSTLPARHPSATGKIRFDLCYALLDLCIDQDRPLDQICD
jgi:hypothetical protein